MDLGTLTIKDVLVKKFGDKKAAQILSKLQEGIDQNLTTDELRQIGKSVAEQEGLTITPETSDISSVSAASLVAI